ncbi:hypothetical protein GF415_05305 [Candidatus Micrarchaeota archaeon]|nr:hypothetical protein [Candidatus Micrarchaeota archaeon]
MQSRAARLPAQQEGKKTTEVHIPTREKAEVNREHFEQLNEEIGYLARETGPTADQQFEDPVCQVLAGLNNPEVVPFLNSEVWKLRIDLSAPGVDREWVEEAFSKESYTEVRHLSEDVVEITNPYYLPSELRKDNGSMAKKLKGFLEKIRDSGSPSAIMAAHACMLELRDYFSTSDLNKLQQSDSPSWLKEHFSEVSKAYGELAHGMVERIEYISRHATGKNRLKPVSIPEGFEKSKKRTLKEIAALEKDLLDGSLGKNAIKRIEWGIKRKCYSVVEVAFYENVRRELESLLMEFRGNDYIEKGFSSIGRDNSEKIELAVRYVGMLETIAWKADLEAVRLKLNAAKRPGEPGELRKSLSLRSWIFGARSSVLWGARSMAARLFHKRPPKKVRAATRSEMLGGLSVFEEMRLVLSSKRELQQIGKRASAYSQLLSSWIDETLPGARIGRGERHKHFSSLGGSISGLSADAEKLQGVILPSPDDGYWEKTEEISKLGNEEKRGRERKKLSWQYQAERLLEVADAFEMDVSREQKTIGEDVLRSVEMARNQDVLLDENAPWDEKVAAYNRQFVMQNAVPILATSTAIGGILGAAAGGVGAKPGAILGWGTGALIVGAAGTFNTGESLADYLAATTEAEEESALADLRGSAFYMGFGIGGGPLRFFSGTAAKAVSGTSFFGLGAANSVLLYHDIKRASEGDSAAYWEIPADVAFIAIGSVGFMKTFSGAWKTVSLPRYVSKELKGKSLIGGSFALTERQIGTRLPKILSRAVSGGYSPGFVALNSAFSLGFSLPEMKYAAGKGKYKQAMNVFSAGFGEMSRGMVTFEFVLAGAGMGASKVLRKFPVKTVPRLNFLQASGLHTKISKISKEAGAKVSNPKMQERLVEIAFGSRGKLSSEQIQRMLALEGEAGKKAAEEISREVSKGWRIARENFPLRGTVNFKRAWKRIEPLLEPATVISRASVPLLVGSSIYMEYSNERERLLSGRLEKVLTPSEADFINSLFSKSDNSAAMRNSFGIPKLEYSKILDAFEKIDRETYSPIKKRNEAEKRLRVSCAIALLMSKKRASAASVEQLSVDLHNALEGIESPPSSQMPVDSLAEAAYVVYNKGPGHFKKRYAQNRKQAAAEWQGGLMDLFVCSTAGIFASLQLNKGQAWSASATREFLAEVEKLPARQRTSVRGWAILSGMRDLETGTDAASSVALMLDATLQSNFMLIESLTGE